MTEKNDGGPAFPQEHGIRKQYQPTGIITGEILIQGNPGMSLRDYFAAKAMQGLLSNFNVNDDLIYSDMAYKIADEMLEAREKK